MSDHAIYIAGLIGKHLEGRITPSESHELREWLAASPENQKMFSEFNDGNWVSGELAALNKYDLEAGRKKISEYVPEFAAANIQPQVPVRTFAFWKWAVAAALTGVIATGAFFFLNTSEKTKAVQEVAARQLKPGGNKAVLTLADGKTIVLDSTTQGALAEQGGVQIIKLGNGQLTYKGIGSDASAINTLTTPRGGQIQVTLPDGTNVWLNSASSLKYPTVFKGNTREVTLDGEGYFEVAENRRQPFIVKARKTEVRVLGTGFNVMAYNDEEAIRTSLVHGSVKVSADSAGCLLKPGQEAVVPNTPNAFSIHIQTANLEETLAWKEGKFRFDGAPITTIMRQIARWYDVEVEYDGPVSTKEFYGVIPRTEDASQLLDALEIPGNVNFTIEGKKIVVRSGARKKTTNG